MARGDYPARHAVDFIDGVAEDSIVEKALC